jgi:pimeloyl-ACP methyl ester carboxylesterase
MAIAAADATDALPVVELDAGPISYRSVGPDDGPPVVFVHGVLVDGSLWHATADRMAERGYRAITPNWPLGSHPRPMNPDADLSPRGVAHIVLELLAALDLPPVTLVGNDTGGAICQFVVDTDPSAADRLVLTNCDSFRHFPPAAFKPLFWLGRVPGLSWALLQPTRSTLLRHLNFRPLVSGPLDADQTRAWITPGLRDGAVRRDLRKLFSGVKPKELDDVGSRLGRFDRPVLLCWGAKDPFFRLAHARRLAATFPDARLVEIPDARTFVPLDQPTRLADEIAAFVPLSLPPP